jgi:hypothetical protein
MAAGPSIDVTGWLEEQLEQASPDLLRSMVQTFAEALMGAEADAVCGAGYGERSKERASSRSGYRRREWDTRAGSVSLAIPKLRQGSYFPDWLLERRRRAEAALVTVVATSYLLGVSAGGWNGSCRLSGSPGCPGRRSVRWPATWTRRSRRSASGRWPPGRTRSSRPARWC